MAACTDCKSTTRTTIRVTARVRLCATCARARQDKARARARASTRERVYGLTPEQYRLILTLQDGRCYICRVATGARKALAVDHSHTTGLVRGLLCGPCNQFIGRLGDDPEVGQRIRDYLLSPPAQRLGIRAVHRDSRDLRRINGAVPLTARPDPQLGAGLDPFDDGEGGEL